MRRVPLLVALAAALLLSSGAAVADAPGTPACPASVGGQTLGGSSNVGVPGKWLQGDPKTGAEVSCDYPGPAGQFTIYVAWIAKGAPGHAFLGCGAKPDNPATTFVSAHYDAYAGANRASPADVPAAAQALLAVVEHSYAKPCAVAKPPPAKPVLVRFSVRVAQKVFTYLDLYASLRGSGSVHVKQPGPGGIADVLQIDSGSVSFDWVGGNHRAYHARLRPTLGGDYDVSQHILNLRVEVSDSNFPSCDKHDTGTLELAADSGATLRGACGVGKIAWTVPPGRVSVR